MSGHPTEKEVAAHEQAARHEAQVADERALQGTRSVQKLIREAAEKSARKFGFFGVVAALVISVLVGLLSLQNTSDLAAAKVLQEQSERETDAALDSIRRDNLVITGRGQAPVATPNPDDPSDTVAAAVTARVLTQLPAVPTAEQVAAVLGPTSFAMPPVTGPTQAELADRVAAYFQANAASLQGPRGDDGTAGQRGPGPTAAQIQAAVNAAYAANPPPPGRDGTDGTNGRDGDTGPAGVSFTGLQFQRDDMGMCVAVVSLSNGTRQTQPVSDLVCATNVQTPDPTTDPPLTTN